MDGTKFRNTEFFTIDGDKITHVDVYFGSDTVRKSEEAEIHGLIEGTTAAVRAKDAAALASYYASGVLSFDVVNPLQYVGAVEVERRAADWFSSWRGSIDYEIRNLTVSLGDESAFYHSINHVTGTKTDGHHVDMWWRATVGCQKLNGKWMITHLHSSVPFDMNTGQASIDLRP